MQPYYLSQHKNSLIWYAALRDPVTGRIGTKKTTGTTNRKEAERIVLLWLRDGTPQTLKESGENFPDFPDRFWDIDHSKHFKELETMGKVVTRRHAKDMRNVVRRYYVPYWGNTRLKDIDELKLQDFLVWLRTEKKLSASTVNLARNAAFVAIKYAKRHRLIRFFDFDAVLRCSGKPKTRGILEREEVEKIFTTEWRDERSRLVNLIASKTGMRMGEICALKVNDIVLNRIIVRHSWSKEDNGLKCPKNGEEREVPLLPDLKVTIEKYIDTADHILTTDILLFPSDVPGVPYDCEQITEDFYKVLATIGIDETERRRRNIVFHSWRHYCAKNLATVAPKSIGMKILGHKTSAMFDLYTDHIDSETFKVMEKAMKKALKGSEGRATNLSFERTEKIG